MMGLKARIKATGEIIEVSQGIYSPYQYVGDNGAIYTEEEVEILQEVLDSTIDYWARLEHQAAIAAMQGILSDPVLLEATLTNAKKFDLTGPQAVAIDAYHYAHALVEKMKEERK